MGRLSTAKTAKIGSLENFRLYGTWYCDLVLILSVELPQLGLPQLPIGNK